MSGPLDLNGYDQWRTGERADVSNFCRQTDDANDRLAEVLGGIDGIEDYSAEVDAGATDIDEDPDVRWWVKIDLRGKCAAGWESDKIVTRLRELADQIEYRERLGEARR